MSYAECRGTTKSHYEQDHKDCVTYLFINLQVSELISFKYLTTDLQVES